MGLYLLNIYTMSLSDKLKGRPRTLTPLSSPPSKESLLSLSLFTYFLYYFLYDELLDLLKDLDLLDQLSYDFYRLYLYFIFGFDCGFGLYLESKCFCLDENYASEYPLLEYNFNPWSIFLEKDASCNLLS